MRRAESIERAIDAAERFLSLAKPALAKHKSISASQKTTWDTSAICGSRTAGEMKRASLDLSMRLSEMRKA